MTETFFKPLPDADLCRTLYLGQILELSECLVPSPFRCPYARMVENSFFCRHPDCRKFEKPAPQPR